MDRVYNVYGIGNALVDIQYQVDPSFLDKMGIVKGVMTLIEECIQEELIEKLRGTELKRSSGGSAANTLISLANCGGTAYYSCKVGDDEDGDFYLKDLEMAGVDSNQSNRGKGTTGKCLVMITPDADRTMNTFLGITQTFGQEQVDEEVIAKSNFLYIEGYLLASNFGFEAALKAQEKARRNGTRVSLTLSDRSIVVTFRDRVNQILEGGVDLLFCNEDEAQFCTDVRQTRTACEILGGSVGLAVVTCGAKGAIVQDGEKSLLIPGFTVEAVDSNGAGDAFAGAFLFGITHGYDVAQSGKLAAYVSSRVVAKYGPRPDLSIKGNLELILGL